MKRLFLVAVLLAVASFTSKTIEAQQKPEKAEVSLATNQDRLVVFESFMRPI
ncbi:MAG: hypothetical protein JXA42_08615 [Anaerolineales bacterium]|nr:hypothetical protein [Anaerolineales bacterium]